ncbi:MAG TPA: hypothetical protein VFO06_04665 [Gemmatimonadales bacterium]|nr:hypothetical protein [Gemmatimonadales bacterium]
MGSINWPRCFSAGLAAGAVILVVEGVAGTLYEEGMLTALAGHNLTLPTGARAYAAQAIGCLLTGLALAFFYAAARPRLGPGPKTAMIVALIFWLGGVLPMLSGYELIELFPSRMIALWSVIGLVELTLGALAGGWVYRESTG